MDLTTCIKEMGAAIEAYTERHGEEPNVLYMTARLMARIEAWVLRDGFVSSTYGYKSGFGMMPNGHVEWFSGLAVKLLDGEGDVCERCRWQRERAIRMWPVARRSRQLQGLPTASLASVAEAD